MSEDIFAGILGGNFGDTIKPEELIDALIEHNFVRSDDSRVRFTILKDFTVYSSVHATDVAWKNATAVVTKVMLYDSYFFSMNNRHLYND